MSARIDQATNLGWRFWFAWMLATVMGGAVGMFLSFPFQVILEAAIGGIKAPPWTTSETILIMVCKGAEGGMMGLGMGLGQWLVFRKYLAQTQKWIFATGLALFLQGAFRWSLPSDISSEHIGISTMLSFGVFLGVCQWFVLRGRVLHAEWWIAINIAGWILTLALNMTPFFAHLDIESIPGMIWFGVNFLVPFAVAGVGMIWLLQKGTLQRAFPT